MFIVVLAYTQLLKQKDQGDGGPLLLAAVPFSLLHRLHIMADFTTIYTSSSRQRKQTLQLRKDDEFGLKDYDKRF